MEFGVMFNPKSVQAAHNPRKKVMGFNIRKTDANEWHLDIRVFKAGKEVRKRETFRGTKHEADERFLFLKNEIRNGYAMSPARKLLTFGDVLNLYRDKCESFSETRRSLYSILMRALGEVALPAFVDSFEAFLKYHRVNPSPVTKKPLANSSLNRFREFVITAFNMAVNLEVLVKNPINPMRFPKLREVPRDRVLTQLESVRLLNILSVDAPHLMPMVRYAMQVPCRRSELVGMLREDLDMFNKVIRPKTTKGDGSPSPRI